jgi:hypothetical protein
LTGSFPIVSSSFGSPNDDVVTRRKSEPRTLPLSKPSVKGSGARGSVVGRGIALQAGRSRVQVPFPIKYTVHWVRDNVYDRLFVRDIHER